MRASGPFLNALMPLDCPVLDFRPTTSSRLAIRAQDEGRREGPGTGKGYTRGAKGTGKAGGLNWRRWVGCGHPPPGACWQRRCGHATLTAKRLTGPFLPAAIRGSPFGGPLSRRFYPQALSEGPIHGSHQWLWRRHSFPLGPAGLLARLKAIPRRWISWQAQGSISRPKT